MRLSNDTTAKLMPHGTIQMNHFTTREKGSMAVEMAESFADNHGYTLLVV
jgi:hypothetical protein